MKRNLKIINQNDEGFPFLLKEIQNPPSRIFVAGELPDDSPAGNRLKIAIVGTRKATSIGKALAKNLAKELAELGIVIVSGLAMGIDSAAHQGALEAKGKTIAVLANGLDKIYPSQNEGLAEKIIESGGALISEYPEGVPSYPNQFLERNRIVSGLCAATIIIEAPERSGSLATAKFAIEQGREVFVIPGPANHPNYIGSHRLIRDGARLIASTKDVLEDLNIEIKKELQSDFNDNDEFSKIHSQILKAVSQAGEPLNIDKISQLTKLNSQAVNQSIAFLVINGKIKETERGYTI